jgi:hypothetical protein
MRNSPSRSGAFGGGEGGVNSSSSSTAGKNDRMRSARSGKREAYSSGVGSSPRRRRARYSSASASTGSRSASSITAMSPSSIDKYRQDGSGVDR